MNELLKVDDIMRILKVSRTTAYALIHSGNLRTFKVGRLVRIRAVDLQKFVEGVPAKIKSGRRIQS